MTSAIDLQLRLSVLTNGNRLLSGGFEGGRSRTGIWLESTTAPAATDQV